MSEDVKEYYQTYIDWETMKIVKMQVEHHSESDALNAGTHLYDSQTRMHRLHEVWFAILQLLYSDTMLDKGL